MRDEDIKRKADKAEAQIGQKRARGRPSTYTPELATLVCQRVAAGESLRSVCRGEGMPDASTVRQWELENRGDFSQQYRNARKQQMESLADDLLEIADEGSGDAIRDKLRVNTRQWLMSRIAPKIYGDRLTTELTGKDGGPLTVNITGRDADL